MPETEQPNDPVRIVWLQPAVDRLVTAVGIVLVLLIGWRLLGVLWAAPPEASQLGNLTTLLLIGLAALVWPSVVRLKTPFVEIERATTAARRQIEQAAEEKKAEVKEFVADVQAPVAVAKERATPDDPFVKAEASLGAITRGEDPQHGRFGSDRTLDRKLTAQVEKQSDGLYVIRLELKALPGFPKLDGFVKFFLHHSFDPGTRIVGFNDGVAILKLYA